jgi:F-type H+-transporting ATPase subunit epsilon
MSDAENNTGFVQFDLVSPEKKLLSQAVSMVVLPGEEGDFGVLVGHAPIVSTMRSGVVAVYNVPNDQHPELYFIDGGFADVTAEQCTVLAEYAVKLPEIDQDALAEEIKSLHEDIQAVNDNDEADIDDVKRKLDIALSKQEALSLHLK